MTSQTPARRGTATSAPMSPAMWAPASRATSTARACRPVARPTKCGARSLPSTVWAPTITASVTAASVIDSFSAERTASTAATVAPTNGTMLKTAAIAPMSRL